MLTRVAARAELRFRAALICGPALRREASAFDARVSSSSSGNARPLRSIAVLPLELGRRRAEPRNLFWSEAERSAACNDRVDREEGHVISLCGKNAPYWEEVTAPRGN